MFFCIIALSNKKVFIFFSIFKRFFSVFLYIKNGSKILSENQRNVLNKSLRKLSKSFWRRKRQKTGNQYRKLFKGNELSEAKKDEKTSICGKSL